MENTPQRFKYYAFISYSRKDEQWAKWLHNKLETYSLPNIIRKESNGTLPKDIRPVFLDKTDISVGRLETSLTRELEDSRFLIVVCSPNSANSEWVNREVAHFKKMGRGDRIIPFIVEGSPEPKGSEKQCYPPALDKDILGASLTELPKEQAFIKIVATILGLKFDDLWQRHERRRKRQRNINYTVGSLLTVAVLLTCFFTWDYYRDKVKYYVDYVDRFGIPNGIFELTDEQAEKHAGHYRFVYNRGKLREVGFVNSADVVMPYFTEIGDIGRPIKQKIEYLETGELETITYEDDKGHVMMVNKYPKENCNEIDFKSKRGKDALLFTNTGVTAGLIAGQRTKINHNSLERNEKGEITKRIFKYGGLDVVSDGNGIYGYQYELDELGRIDEVLYLDKDGNPKQNSTGVAGVRFEYDERGNIIECIYFNLKNEYAKNEFGYAKCSTTWDVNGNLTQEVYYGEDDAATLNIGGYAKRISIRDGRGNVTMGVNFGVNDEPVLDSSGVAIYKNKYNENSLMIEEAFFDDKGERCYDKYGVSIYRREYDDRGNMVVEKRYDANEKLSYNKDGFAIIKYKVDDNRNITERSFYDVNEQRCNCKEGFAICKIKIDEEGRETEEAYFDVNGNACYNNLGVSVAMLEYNERGNPKKLSHFDINGTPCLNNRKYSSCVVAYQDNGNVSEMKFYDVDGTPGYYGGCFKTKFEYKGNVVIVTYEAADESSCYDEYGVARCEMTLNEKGKVSAVDNYDATGALMMSKDGFGQKRFEYDVRGNLFREAYFDVDGRPYMPQGRAHIMEYEYNDRGKITESRQYRANYELFSDEESLTNAVVKNAYDERGNLVEQSFYNKYGPTMEMDGFFKVKFTYDELDRKIEERYYDLSDNLVLCDDDYAIVAYQYDVMGNVLQKSFYGTDGEPCETFDWYATEKCTYSKEGRLTSVSYFDVKGEPCRSKNRFHCEGFKIDVFGNVVRDSFLDADGSICNNRNGIHKYITEYDNRGNMTKNVYASADGYLPYEWAPMLLRYYDKRNNVTQKVYADMNGNPYYENGIECPIVTIAYNEKGQQVEEKYYHSYTEECKPRPLSLRERNPYWNRRQGGSMGGGSFTPK